MAMVREIWPNVLSAKLFYSQMSFLFRGGLFLSGFQPLNFLQVFSVGLFPKRLTSNKR